jgi:hypothetical protein
VLVFVYTAVKKKILMTKFIKNRSLFLVDLEAGKSKIKVLSGASCSLLLKQRAMVKVEQVRAESNMEPLS